MPPALGALSVPPWLDPRRAAYGFDPRAAASRDLRLDLLRGFCVFAMIVDHIGGESWLYAITGGNRFYVSAAEGFIFISGVVMGQAYRAKVNRDGLVTAMLEALRRARTLYLATVALTLIFSLLYLRTGLILWTSREVGLGIEDPVELVVATLTLHFTYHGSDILLMYAVLVLAAPIVLLLLTLGGWRWVLAVAWLWWAAYQQYPERASAPWPIVNADNFPLAAWQVLFMTGLVLGFHRVETTLWLRRWPHVRVAGAALGLAATLGFLSLYWGIQAGARVPAALPFAFFDIDPDLLGEQFFKVPLRPWRLAAFAAVSIGAYVVLTTVWQPVQRLTGWLLLPLGQHALYGYIVHTFLIVVVYNGVNVLLTEDLWYQPLATTAIQLAAVLVLWGMIKRRILFGVIPN